MLPFKQVKLKNFDRKTVQEIKKHIDHSLKGLQNTFIITIYWVLSYQSNRPKRLSDSTH